MDDSMDGMRVEEFIHRINNYQNHSKSFKQGARHCSDCRWVLGKLNTMQNNMREYIKFRKEDDDRVDWNIMILEALMQENDGDVGEDQVDQEVQGFHLPTPQKSQEPQEYRNPESDGSGDDSEDEFDHQKNPINQLITEKKENRRKGIPIRNIHKILAAQHSGAGAPESPAPKIPKMEDEKNQKPSILDTHISRMIEEQKQEAEKNAVFDVEMEDWQDNDEENEEEEEEEEEEDKDVPGGSGIVYENQKV